LLLSGGLKTAFALSLTAGGSRWPRSYAWRDSGPKRVRTMRFMVIEHVRKDRASEVYRRFREQGRMAPNGVRYISSWVDLDFERCFQVMEAENVEALGEWTVRWDDLIDFEIVPVRTSEEASAIMASQS
jgi:hypothetical protein